MSDDVMKIVCLGDSLTYGFGVPRKDTWAQLTAVHTGYNLINRGINGDTTSGMLARFQRDVLDEHPDAVLLMGGANDIITSGTELYARSNMAALMYQAVDHKVTPLLGLAIPVHPEMIPMPWSEMADFKKLVPVFSAYRTWQCLFAKVFSLQIVDFAKGFDDQEGYKFYLDGLHPNAEGHLLMSDILCSVLNTFKR